MSKTICDPCQNVKRPSFDKIVIEQDGPSLESSSYLKMNLRYLGPLDLGPWVLFYPPPLPHTFSLPLWYALAWGEGGVRWLLSSNVKRFQCYFTQKSFMWWVVDGGISIIESSSRSDRSTIPIFPYDMTSCLKGPIGS